MEKSLYICVVKSETIMKHETKNDRFELSSTPLVAVWLFNDKNLQVRKVLKGSGV